MALVLHGHLSARMSVFSVCVEHHNESFTCHAPAEIQLARLRRAHKFQGRWNVRWCHAVTGATREKRPENQHKQKKTGEKTDAYTRTNRKKTVRKMCQAREIN